MKNSIVKKSLTKSDCSRTKVEKWSSKNFEQKGLHVYNNCFKLRSTAIK